MPDQSSPSSFNKLLEVAGRYRRRLIYGLTALSLLYHLTLMLLPAPYQSALFEWGVVGGLLLTVIALYFNIRRARFRTIHKVAIALMGNWILVDTAAGIELGEGVTQWMMLDLLLGTLVILAFVPETQAMRYVGALYLAFVGSAFLAGPLDLMLLLNLLFLVVFAVYLAFHGSAVSAERERNAQLYRELRIDGLTGVLNRRTIEAELRRQAAQVGRVRSGYLVMMLDLDHFKQINDCYGHLMGDEVLRATAQHLKHKLGNAGIVGRWGGEEFMVLVGVPTPDAGYALAEQLRQSVSRLHTAEHSPAGMPPLTVSIGAAMAQLGDEPLELVSRADALLYAAKAAGRNCVKVAGLADSQQ